MGNRKSKRGRVKVKAWNISDLPEEKLLKLTVLSRGILIIIFMILLITLGETV